MPNTEEKLNTFVNHLEPGIKLMMPVLMAMLTVISTLVFGKLNSIDSSMTLLAKQIERMTERIQQHEKRISYLEWERERSGPHDGS